MGSLDSPCGQDAFAARHFDQSDVGNRLTVTIAPIDRGCKVLGRTAGCIVKARIAECRRIQCDKRALSNRLIGTCIQRGQHVVYCYSKRVAHCQTVVVLNGYGHGIGAIIAISMSGINRAISTRSRTQRTKWKFSYCTDINGCAVAPVNCGAVCVSRTQIVEGCRIKTDY